MINHEPVLSIMINHHSPFLSFIILATIFSTANVKTIATPRAMLPGAGTRTNEARLVLTHQGMFHLHHVLWLWLRGAVSTSTVRHRQNEPVKLCVTREHYALYTHPSSSLVYRESSVETALLRGHRRHQCNQSS